MRKQEWSEVDFASSVEVDGDAVLEWPWGMCTKAEF